MPGTQPWLISKTLLEILLWETSFTPHINEHKGGVDFTDTRHKHKKLQEGNEVRKANCQAVIDDLKDGNDREKKIATWIKDKLL